MTISKTALINHEELFPNRKSKLLETDPELIEVFDNFAFDEVLAYGNLDTKTRLMVIWPPRSPARRSPNTRSC